MEFTCSWRVKEQVNEWDKYNQWYNNAQVFVPSCGWLEIDLGSLKESRSEKWEVITRARRWAPWPVPSSSLDSPLHSGLPGPGCVLLGSLWAKIWSGSDVSGRRAFMSVTSVPWSYCNHFVQNHWVVRVKGNCWKACFEEKKILPL